MKLRLAVTLVLALGMFFTGAGAALGVVEVAQNTALEEQYPPNDSKGPRKETISSTSSAPGDAKSSDQENAASDPEELAFTGFLAVPVLVGGIALLGGGLAMRRRL